MERKEINYFLSEKKKYSEIAYASFSSTNRSRLSGKGYLDHISEIEGVMKKSINERKAIRERGGRLRSCSGKTSTRTTKKRMISPGSERRKKVLNVAAANSWGLFMEGVLKKKKRRQACKQEKKESKPQRRMGIEGPRNRNIQTARTR